MFGEANSNFLDSPVTLTVLVNNYSQFFPGLANQSLHISQESQITMLLKRIVRVCVCVCVCACVRACVAVCVHACVCERERDLHVCITVNSTNYVHL